jgi:hypothetical protein
LTEWAEIACRGGWEGTGTALGLPCRYRRSTSQARAAFVRQHYHQHAIETPWQKRYITRFTAPQQHG